MKIVVSTEVETWTTRPRDPSDEWDNGDTAGHVSNVTARAPYDWEKDSGYAYDSWIGEFPDDTSIVFAVVADYESGSTFGRSGGYAQIVDVLADRAEAEALRDAAAADNDYGFEWNGKEYHRSWVGYFERLQDLSVWVLNVGGGGPGEHIRYGR